MSNFKKYFEPCKIGKMELPNRIIMAPMGTGYSEPDGRFTKRHIDYFTQRARGGAGLIITGLTKIEKDLEYCPRMKLPFADSDVMIASMHDLTNAVHDYGGKIALQLTAGLGRQADVIGAATPIISASEIPAFGDPSITCRSITVEEIKHLVESFANAAERAKMGGFDMVEIHGHTGFLVDQFMSDVWNKRTDEYGGDLDNRMRFTIEFIKAVREKVGPDFPISFRLAVEHGIPGGRSIEESKKIARRIEAAGADAIHADAGCYETLDLIFPTSYMGDACLAWAAKEIKKVVNIPVIAVGNMTPEAGEKILEAGEADFIAFGRQLIADPDLPVKMNKGKAEEIRPCIRCNEMCIGNAFAHLPISCSVNTVTGRESYYELKKAETQKKVLVIGGGPAGMEAARVARLKGHKVTLMEKTGILGGQLNAAGAPEFKKELRGLISWFDTQMEKTGVEVLLNEEVTIDKVKQSNPDAVVLAAGAVPVMPDIPGIDGENVIGVIDCHINSDAIKGDNIVIAGGGLSGCDTALDMAENGKQVTIIEMLPELALEMNVVSRISLLGKLAAAGVNMVPGHMIKEFRADGVLAADGEGNDQVFPADSVIMAMGMKSDNALADKLKEEVDELYIIGDCVKPSKVGEAVHTGYTAGWRI